MRTSILGATALLFLLSGCTSESVTSNRTTATPAPAVHLAATPLPVTATAPKAIEGPSLTKAIEGPSLTKAVAPEGWVLASVPPHPTVRREQGLPVLAPVVLRRL